MKILLDTAVLLRAAMAPDTVPSPARQIIEGDGTTLVVSAASLWTLTVLRGRGDDALPDPRLLRRGLLDNGYEELPVTGAHAVAAEALPPLTDDPVTRLLAAQASVEGLLLLSMNDRLAGYPAPVRVV